MNYKLSFILIACSTFSNAQTVHIQSLATPEGINLEKYNQLTNEMNQSNKADPIPKVKHEEAKEKTSNLSKSDITAKIEAAVTAHKDAANKKAEARKVGAYAKRDFENKIIRAWIIPLNSSGQKATAHINLSDNGTVSNFLISASDPDLKASIVQAIRTAAPFPMPSDPDARNQARSFTASFTVK